MDCLDQRGVGGRDSLQKVCTKIGELIVLHGLSGSKRCRGRDSLQKLCTKIGELIVLHVLSGSKRCGGQGFTPEDMYKDKKKKIKKLVAVHGLP